MKSIIPIFALIASLSSSSFGQIETLTANEVGTINLPDSIRTLFTQDLDNDSLSEMIINTGNHLYIYRFGVDQPLWESPELNDAADLQFADINGDSLIDIAVRDSSSIMFYSPHDSSLIYSTSVPELFRCYTVGDANNDGDIDLAIVRQEPFNADYREDSVWVSVYYGPDYISHGDFALTMENYSYSLPYNSYTISQAVSKIIIVGIGPVSNLNRWILVFSNISTGLHVVYEHTYRTYGAIWVVDPRDFHIANSLSFGKCEIVGNLQPIGGQQIPFAVYSYNQSFEERNLRQGSQVHKLWISHIYSSGFVDTVNTINDNLNYQYPPNPPLPRLPDWTYTIGELNLENSNIELCYGYKDTIAEYRMFIPSRLWADVVPADSFIVKGVFNSPDLFTAPEIMIKENWPNSQYLFVSGINHEVNAILPDSISPLSQIADINADGSDEILSIIGNRLHLYSLARITGISGGSWNPGEYLMLSNYPNPFNSQTTIRFILPRWAEVKIEIYDITGRKIERLVDAHREAGANQVIWDASGRPSGIYFYRISAGNESQTGRMTLLK